MRGRPEHGNGLERPRTRGSPGKVSVKLARGPVRCGGLAVPCLRLMRTAHTAGRTGAGRIPGTCVGGPTIRWGWPRAVELCGRTTGWPSCPSHRGLTPAARSASATACYTFAVQDPRGPYGHHRRHHVLRPARRPAHRMQVEPGVLTTSVHGLVMVRATRMRYLNAGRSCWWPTMTLRTAAGQPMAPSRPAVFRARYRGPRRAEIPAMRKHLPPGDCLGAAFGPAELLRSAVSTGSPDALASCGVSRCTGGTRLSRCMPSEAGQLGRPPCRGSRGPQVERRLIQVTPGLLRPGHPARPRRNTR